MGTVGRLGACYIVSLGMVGGVRQVQYSLSRALLGLKRCLALLPSTTFSVALHVCQTPSSTTR